MKILLSFMLIALATVSQAIDIEITRGFNKPTKIAVATFPALGGLKLDENIGAIIENDFLSTGRFEAMQKQAMLNPDIAVTTGFNFEQWRSQDYVILGNIRSEGADLLAAIEVVDINKRKVILGNTIRLAKNRQRDLAHIMADKAFEAITELRGAFYTRIVFVQEYVKSGKTVYELVRVDSDGQRPQLLVRSSEPMLSPAWSKDAKYIAFTTFDPYGKSMVKIYDTSSGKTQIVAQFDGINTSPAFSPDGKYLAFTSSRSGNPDVYIYNLSNGEIKQITNHFAIDIEPEWTQDAQNLVFTSDRGGSPQIYQKNIYTGAWSRLTYEGSYNANPQISSDGRYMIFVHRANNGNFSIASLTLATKSMRILTTSNLDESPSLSPNGSMLVYASKHRGSEVLAWVSVDGEVRSQMPASSIKVREPAWSPYLN